jgi:hypothetical protein
MGGDGMVWLSTLDDEMRSSLLQGKRTEKIRMCVEGKR